MEIKLIRKGLILQVNTNVIPAQGSSLIEILYEDDGTYEGYTVEPRISWHESRCIKSSQAHYADGIITLPAEAFNFNGVIALTVALIDPEDSNHVIVVPPVKMEVKYAPNEKDYVTTDGETTWNELVDKINKLSEEIEDLKENGTGTGITFEDIEDGEIFEIYVPPVPCTKITLNVSELAFTSNATQTLIATVTPTDTTDTITWESNNTSIATVENGVVTPLENGDCTITVSCGEYSASCSVNVNIEEVVVTSNATKVSVETNNGVEYFKFTNANDFLGTDGKSEVLKANTYKNDNYQVYNLSGFANGQYDLTSTDITNSLIPQKQNVTGFIDILNSEFEGDVVGVFGTSLAFRLPIDLNGYATAREYLAGTYGHMYLAKAECNEKVINPSLITSINIKTNDDTCQYAQFGYSDLPTSNIYSGLCSLSGLTGTNANLSSDSVSAPRFAISTFTLSCKFAPNTFEEFTLDNVKQYLTDNPLIFWY